MRFGLSVLVLLLLISQSPTPAAQTANFELTLIIPVDKNYYDAMALTIQQQWSPLLVDVIIEGSPRPVYYSDLINHDYDIAIASLDFVVGQLPPLWETFSKESVIGNEFYNFKDPFTFQKAGVDETTFFSLLDQYKKTYSYAQRVNLAKSLQQLYNQEWLMDIPIASLAWTVSWWAAFEGMNAQEGLINSLFLGAKWASNPPEREQRGRTMDELNYSPINFQKLQVPIYYQSRGDFIATQTVFSSPFLVDKNNNLHPNLAKAFEINRFDDGSEEWLLYLRDDVKWTDGEPLDAYDLKFTYDLVSFPWISASNYFRWSNLEEVTVLNSTLISIKFSDSSLDNMYTIANEYIIPEHILNVTYVEDGQNKHPYGGDNPSNSEYWQSYVRNPVTAGPYVYDPAESVQGVNSVFTVNPNFWYPNELDSPSNIFNLTAGTPSTPYYFEGSRQLNVGTLIYHVSGDQNIDANSFITAFESGMRDLIEIDFLDRTSTILNNDKFVVDTVPIPGSGMVLIFNMDKPELQNVETRRALTLALDRTTLANYLGYGPRPQLTMVSSFYADFYNPTAGIGYDYSAARDIFRKLGYDALDSNAPEQNFEWPWERVPFSFTSFLVAFALMPILYRRRR